MRYRLAKTSLCLILLSLCAAVPATQPVPITITKSGTYGGAPDEPVSVTNVTINAPLNSNVVLTYLNYDNLVVVNPCYITVRDCKDSGAEPTYASAIWRLQGLIFEHNEVHGRCLIVRDFSGKAESVSICYNDFIDVNGATGPTTRDKVSAIQIAGGLRVPDMKILYNRITNHRGASAGEDQISFEGGSGGTLGHPALVQRNLVDGAFNWPVITQTEWTKGVHFSGSGIMAYDPGSAASLSAGVDLDISFNTVCASENQGIACAGGFGLTKIKGLSIHDNRVVNDGTSTPFASYGIQVWNWSNKTPGNLFGTNTAVYGNTSCTFINGRRSDFAIAPSALQTPPNLAITDTEASARAAWAADVAANGIVIGPRPAPPKPASESQPVVMIGNSSIVKPSTGTAAINFTVTLTEPAASAVTINYGTVAVTASSGAGDYVGIPSGTLTIPVGKTTGTISVQVKGNSLDDESKTFQVKITSAVGAQLGTVVGTGTITGIAR